MSEVVGRDILSFRPRGIEKVGNHADRAVPVGRTTHLSGI